MLTKEQATEAVRYNSKRILDGKLKLQSLPWPWTNSEAKVFVWQTALFQRENRLTVDGKLGPGTEKFVKKATDDT